MKKNLRMRLGAIGLAIALTLSLSPATFATETANGETPPEAWREEEQLNTPIAEGEDRAALSAETDEMIASEAAGTFTITGGVAGTDYSYENNTLTILSGTAMTIGGTATADVLVVADVEAHVTFDGLTITAGDYRPAVTIGKGASLEVTLAADKGDEVDPIFAAVLNGGKGRAAIEVPKTAALTVTAASTGTLKATAGVNDAQAYPAAIGGSAWMKVGSNQQYKDDVGAITIDGGTIIATAGNGSGAGIGAACTNNNDLTSHGNITVNGGNVTAIGDPGIGACFAPANGIAQGSIAIHGGTVNGKRAGSGAGGILSTGSATTGGSILIDGGTVTANALTETAMGGDYCTVTIQEDAVMTVTADNGIGIGGKKGPVVNTEGGAVTVTGGDPTNIGGGTASARGTVNISDGTVSATAPASYGCGIGGNYCDVIVSGGEVTAYGAYGGTGIGAVHSSSGTYYGTITITGGVVTAKGSGYANSYGAGIGTAAKLNMDSSAKIIISGGVVTAVGGGTDKADGIGKGTYYKDSSDNSRPTGENYFFTSDNGNALIFASSIGDKAAQADWGGAIFEGTGGKVYASPTLEWDGEIPVGYTLNNEAGHTLGIAEDVNLTVKGTINNAGVFNDYGTLDLTATGGSFCNATTGVFNWYGTKTVTDGDFDTDAAGNVVNYASTVTTTASTAGPSYGDEVTFTATIARRDELDATLTAGGTVDFFVGETKITTDPVTVVLAPDGKTMTAAYTAYMMGATWQAGASHTVTARYSGAKGAPSFQLDKADNTGVSVTVAKKALDNSMIAAIDAVTFNGSAHTPTPVVTHTVNGANAITTGDYTVAHSDNRNAGTATVTVTAKDGGNYSGTAKRTFIINKAAAPVVDDTVKNLYYLKAYTGLTLNVAAKLPADRGTTTYTVDAAGGPVTTNTVSEVGLLTYATQAGSIDDAHTITVTAVMQNYENAAAKVAVTLKDKIETHVTGGITMESRPYNGRAAAYTGTPVTDQPEYTGGFEYRWSSVSENVATPLDAAPVNAGSYRLTVSIPDSSEEYMGSTDFDFTITPAAVTVAPGIYVVTKVYDGATTAGTPSGALTVSGILPGDKETVAVAAVPGAYAAANAAGNLKVNAALTLEGTGIANYALAANTVEVPASITPKAITIVSATVDNHVYDGTTAATVSAVTFTGVVTPLVKGTGYTAVGVFESVNVGSAKRVDVTVTLLDTNYTLAQRETTANADITKATAGAAAPLTLNVANKCAHGYSVYLPAALPTPAEHCTFGAVRYAVGVVTDANSIFASTPVGGVADGILELSVKNVDSATETAGAATVAVAVSSDNYQDFTITLTLNTVNRKAPVGVPTAEGALTYGQQLSELKLTGEMKDGETVVPGGFSWSGGENRPAVDVEQAVWLFTPADETAYLTVSGKRAITVAKAVPVGTPTATVSESGKTLADAGLTGTFTNAHSSAAVAGTLTWNDPATTEVSANRSFSWTFIPADTANYESATGTLTPWQVSYGGGGASTPGTKNPDGSTTTTVTDKKTGVVTETTKWLDGSQTVVESRKDGSSTVEMKRKDGASSKTEIAADGKTESIVTLTAKAVEGQQGKITLPMPQVTVTVQKEAAAVVKVEAPTGTAVKVEIPAKGVNAGTVAILVLPNGEERIVKSCVATDTGVVLSVSAGATIKIVDNSKNFGDVPADHWGTEAIQFAASHELFQGTGDAAFSPAEYMTRGMLMTVLARYDGQDTTSGESWYSAGMNWAETNGISDGSGPDADVSREQLAVMLYRYAGSPATTGALERFADADAVSDYAAAALRWAVEQGIVSGKGGNALDPLGGATRAEVAAMLQRFVSQTAK